MTGEASPTPETETPPVATSGRLSTSAMCLALLTFPLPWLNLSCGKHTPGAEAIYNFTVTQSGLQSTYGGVTFYAGDMNEAEARASGENRRRTSGAPLMVVYALLLAGGIIASVKLSGTAQLKAVAACSTGALAVLVAQMAVGFPLVPENANKPPDPLYHMFIECRYTPWFWGALAFTIAAPVLTWCEWCWDTTWKEPPDETDLNPTIQRGSGR